MFSLFLVFVVNLCGPSALAEVDLYLDTKVHPTANLLITTSPTSYSGTMDAIYATFIGDFATTGPYNIGTFVAGVETWREVPLDHLIGELQKIHLYNNGTDGWLMSDFKCYMNSHIYEFQWNRQWLDTIDPVLLELYGNGYEPYAPQHSLPAQSTQLLHVVSKTLLTDISGIYRPKLVHDGPELDKITIPA